MEGLCVLLRGLSYPCRFSDIIPRFGRPVPVLSMVSSQVLDYIYDIHGHRITPWNHQILSQPLLQLYSDTIAAQGSALDNCFGFVDGTVRPIFFSNFQKEEDTMQACWQIQDSLMTSKHLQTPLLEIHTAFMVIHHTL